MSERTENITTYTLKADYSNLGDLREFIISEAKKNGCENDNAYLISLAVDEACTNLIRYAYKFDKSKRIEIVLKPEKNKFSVIIKDSGKPFNPLEVPPPDMQEYFNEFKKGGLGIFIINKAMDEVKYKAGNNNEDNELTLVKYMPSKNSHPQ